MITQEELQAVVYQVNSILQRIEVRVTELEKAKAETEKRETLTRKPK